MVAVTNKAATRRILKIMMRGSDVLLSELKLSLGTIYLLKNFFHATMVHTDGYP
jgi:hypothetical protein